MTHTHASSTIATAAGPPNLEWSAALALCREYGVGKETLAKWRDSDLGGLCWQPPGRVRRKLYRRDVLLRLCGGTD